MCHEYRAWRNARDAQESRRDLWQEFEEETRRSDEESIVESPQPSEVERAEEPVTAGP